MTNDLEKYGIKNSERTPCEIWTRVMGYHRPISSFNIGKQGEVAERRYFDEKKCCCRKQKSKDTLGASLADRTAATHLDLL